MIRDKISGMQRKLFTLFSPLQLNLPGFVYNPFLQWIIFALIFLFLYALLVYSLHANHDMKKQEYIERSMNTLDSRIDTTVENLEKFSRYVFESAVNKPEVVSIMCRAWKNDAATQAVLRERLYYMILPVYEHLGKYNFRQLQFHFPDSVSFLRMHSKKDFGDSLYNVRLTVRQTNETMKPSVGFEEGRVLNGYRFVYPLFDREKHCGSAEVSFSMGPFLDVLRGPSGAELFFAVKRSVAESIVFPDQLQKYSESSFSSEYLFDRDLIKGETHAGLFAAPDISIADHLERADSFGFAQKYGDTTYLVLFKSIKNLRREHVAYIISISEDRVFDRISREYLAIMTVSTLGSIAVFVLSALFFAERKKLKRMSSIDLLTNIHNRHVIITGAKYELERARRYGIPVSLIIFDIDHFKSFNDEYGHNEGDHALRKIADTVKKTLRKTDYFGRWGGEEFIALLPHTNLEGAIAAAENIRLSVSSADISRFRKVTISLGVAEHITGETFESLVGRADNAMYIAKFQGRNCARQAN
jgi:diguanylate cyclase (GGDEF)-like protein